jgi:Fic family protein
LLSGVERSQDKMPGNVRTTQNYIASPGTPIERAKFVPPSPQNVMPALHNWEEYVHFDEKDPLVQLSVLKAQFELIHPFRDGNGRIGRILVPLILYGKGLLSSPMLYISSYLERNRDVYYDRLNSISRKADWNGWIDFFLQAVIDQADENNRKARAIIDLYNQMKQTISDISHSPYSLQALDAIFSSPIFSSRDFIQRSGIPRDTSLRVIRQLVKNQILITVREQSGPIPAVMCFLSLLKIAEGI